MPLTINVDRCENSEELRPRDENGNEGRDSMTVVVALLMEHIGLPKITEANFPEFVRRVVALEQVWGPQAHNLDGSPRMFEIGDIRRRIGMFTNWPPKSKSQFDKEIKEEREKQERGEQAWARVKDLK